MLSNLDIARPFVRSTIEILSLMAGINASAGTPYVKKGVVAEGDVSAIVGVTGDRTGSIAVSFTKPCAVALVKGMLGEDIQDALQDIQDAVGEMTNMVSGQARAGLRELGLTLSGSTPTIIIGDGHTIRHVSRSPVIAIPFTTPDGGFTVEFCFEEPADG
ncbi:MAG: chemotaxis protein CheX [Desulfovibrio sp.]|jgi:chemotaxis protein CheX|nr:chemotaxis protein CheX [Desulfovibrio sp.]